MSEAYLPPASIECAIASIVARKVIQQIPVRRAIGTLGQRTVYPYSFDRNSSATIRKELTPKKPVINVLSKLSMGDCIKGDAISGFATEPIKNRAVAPASGRHKSEFFDIKASLVYARLEKAYQSLERMQIKKALPSL